LDSNENNFADVNALIGRNVRDAGENEYPFIASILRILTEDESEIVYACVGALISRKDVLTTNHCMDDEELNKIKIIIGSTYLTGTNKYYPLWWKSYNDWMQEKRKNLEFRLNDIAIIRVNKCVFFKINLFIFF
jgi:secreted trypsin-like serine protease